MPEEQRIIRNVEISAALDGGFAIRDRDSYDLLAVVPNLVGLEPRLRAIFATAVTVESDFAEVGDTTQPAEEEPRATDNVEGAMAPDMVDEEYRYLAVYGQSKGEATSKIVAYDEQTALAIVKAVLDVGGFGWTETIRSV